VPFFLASSIAYSAWIPCPYPKEIAFNGLFFCSANDRSIFMGSDPGKINISGEKWLESEKLSDKLNGGG
jgi:hypothetical protein